MVAKRFARLPSPPYFAVVFSSTRADADPAYDVAAARMEVLAAVQPGFLGIESSRDAEGFGITVSYWRSEQDILAWKRNAEHAAAREQGRNAWYQHFELRIARVERAYGGPTTAPQETQPVDSNA